MSVILPGGVILGGGVILPGGVISGVTGGGGSDPLAGIPLALRLQTHKREQEYWPEHILVEGAGYGLANGRYTRDGDAWRRPENNMTFVNFGGAIPWRIYDNSGQLAPLSPDVYRGSSNTLLPSDAGPYAPSPDHDPAFLPAPTSVTHHAAGTVPKTVQSLHLSGAGTIATNGYLAPVGFAQGKPYYDSATARVFWNGNFWLVESPISSGTIAYSSPDNVATPDLISTWEVGVGGTAPVPTVELVELPVYKSLGLYQDAACTIPALNDGDPIGGWRDEISGSLKKITVSISTKRPTLRFVNGVPVVRCDGIDDDLAGTDLTTQTNSRFVSIGLALRGDTQYKSGFNDLTPGDTDSCRILFRGPEGQGLWTRVSDGSNLWQAIPGVNMLYKANVPFVVGGLFAKTIITARINGVELKRTTGANANIGTGFQINSGVEPPDADITSIILADDLLDAQFAAVDAYAATLQPPP